MAVSNLGGQIPGKVVVLDVLPAHRDVSSTKCVHYGCHNLRLDTMMKPLVVALHVSGVK